MMRALPVKKGCLRTQENTHTKGGAPGRMPSPHFVYRRWKILETAAQSVLWCRGMQLFPEKTTADHLQRS